MSGLILAAIAGIAVIVILIVWVKLHPFLALMVGAGVLAVLAGVALSGLLAWKTEPGQQFFTFAREATVEARKVVWPNRKEAMQTTGLVFAFVVIMAFFLWVTDKSIEWVLYDLILQWRKS